MYNFSEIDEEWFKQESDPVHMDAIPSLDSGSKTPTGLRGLINRNSAKFAAVLLGIASFSPRQAESQNQEFAPTANQIELDSSTTVSSEEVTGTAVAATEARLAGFDKIIEASAKSPTLFQSIVDGFSPSGIVQETAQTEGQQPAEVTEPNAPEVLQQQVPTVAESTENIEFIIIDGDLSTALQVQSLAQENSLYHLDSLDFSGLTNLNFNIEAGQQFTTASLNSRINQRVADGVSTDKIRRNVTVTATGQSSIFQVQMQHGTVVPVTYIEVTAGATSRYIAAPFLVKGTQGITVPRRVQAAPAVVVVDEPTIEEIVVVDEDPSASQDAPILDTQPNLTPLDSIRNFDQNLANVFINSGILVESVYGQNLFGNSNVTSPYVYSREIMNTLTEYIHGRTPSREELNQLICDLERLDSVLDLSFKDEETLGLVLSYTVEPEHRDRQYATLGALFSRLQRNVVSAIESLNQKLQAYPEAPVSLVSADSLNETVEYLSYSEQIRNNPEQFMDTEVSYTTKKGKTSNYVFKGITEDGYFRLAKPNNHKFIFNVRDVSSVAAPSTDENVSIQPIGDVDLLTSVTGENAIDVLDAPDFLPTGPTNYIFNNKV
jgi:hypothetical protein